MFNVYLSLVCRTGDLVLIAPRFLALGCQLPVLHHHSKIHRYQTTSPSLGGSQGPGSGRPQSQRLQTTLSQRRLQSLTEANLRQTRNRCVLQKLSPAREATPVSQRAFCPGGGRGMTQWQTNCKERRPRKYPWPRPVVRGRRSLQFVCHCVMPLPPPGQEALPHRGCITRWSELLQSSLVLVFWPSEFGSLFFTVLPWKYAELAFVFSLFSLSIFSVNFSAFNANQLGSLPNIGKWSLKIQKALWTLPHSASRGHLNHAMQKRSKVIECIE